MDHEFPARAEIMLDDVIILDNERHNSHAEEVVTQQRG